MPSSFHKKETEKNELVARPGGKQLPDATSLRDHEMRHKGVKQFKCDVCGHMTVTKTALQSHVRYNHPEKAPNYKPFGEHICHECGKCFKSKGALSEHSWTHSNQQHPQFQCPICHKYMKQSNSFRKHMSNVHKVHHKCDECTKTFPTKFGLVRHKIDCHGGTLDLEFHRDQGATERSLVPQQPSTPLDQI